jgi:serine/threonine protein kinase
MLPGWCTATSSPPTRWLTGRDFVYLIDFGIAHDAAATKLTGTGQLVGTMAYMAHERFTAGLPIPARTSTRCRACCTNASIAPSPIPVRASNIKSPDRGADPLVTLGDAGHA